MAGWRVLACAGAACAVMHMHAGGKERYGMDWWLAGLFSASRPASQPASQLAS